MNTNLSSVKVMQHILTISTLLLSSSVVLTFLSDSVNASPSCYGIDEAGNTLDLSQLCQPSSQENSLPPTSTNNQPTEPTKPEESQGIQDNKEPEISGREEGEKDIQACFNSPTCLQIMEGNNQPDTTPHQVRMNQVLNGGAIKQY